MENYFRKSGREAEPLNHRKIQVRCCLSRPWRAEDVRRQARRDLRLPVAGLDLTHRLARPTGALGRRNRCRADGRNFLQALLPGASPKKTSAQEVGYLPAYRNLSKIKSSLFAPARLSIATCQPTSPTSGGVCASVPMLNLTPSFMQADSTCRSGT